MKKLVLLLLVAVAVFAANSVFTTGISLNTHPQPPVEYEFYWDDGIMTAGWVWYTGGNYWAVQFDDEKTGGNEYGGVTMYAAAAHPSWPDSAFQGVYMHTLDDLGGYPGTDLDSTFCQLAVGGEFEWFTPDNDCVQLTTSVFYIAWEQIGNYPYTDAMGVDAVAGTHNWTGFQGSWAPGTAYGDFLLRCYWEEDGCGIATEETSWGAIKNLY